jgi:hypothetical protein
MIQFNGGHGGHGDAVTLGGSGVFPEAKLCPVGFNPSGKITPPDTGITAVFVTLLADGSNTAADNINVPGDGTWSAQFPPLGQGDFSVTASGTVNSNTVSPLHFNNQFCQVH